MFAIVDVDNKSKEFFLSQNLVKFQKLWFIRDHISKPTKRIDLEYLISFEKKYDVNLWLLTYSDRDLSQLDNYYRFRSDEILSIFEQNCKFFESIFDEVQPDFIILRPTDDFQTEILHKMCKSKKIGILTLNATRIGSRGIISQTTDFFDTPFDPSKINVDNIKTFEELSDYIRKYRDGVKKFTHKAGFSTLKRLKASFKFFVSYYDSNYTSYFRNYGKTRLRILIREGQISVKKWYRESFINRKSLRIVDDTKQFVYFPIHFEPERQISMLAPFYTNQVEVIANIAKSLPVNYLLYVKDHPVQATTGWKRTSFYKKILDLPNVRLIHSSVSGEEILKKCSLVITIAGTSGLEAAFYNKPSIVLMDTQYSCLSFVHRLSSMEELPKVIRTALETKVDLSELNKFVKFMLEDSFEYDEVGLVLTLTDMFLYGGFPLLDISLLKINSFLKEYGSFFGHIALEYIKKINQIKKENYGKQENDRKISHKNSR